MAIRNTLLGGTDWSETTEEALYGADLNDTFNAVINHNNVVAIYTGTDVDVSAVAGCTASPVSASYDIISLTPDQLANKTYLKTELTGYLSVHPDGTSISASLSLQVTNDGGVTYTGINSVSLYLDDTYYNRISETLSRTTLYELTDTDKLNGITVRIVSTANCGSSAGSDVYNRNVNIYLI